MRNPGRHRIAGHRRRRLASLAQAEGADNVVLLTLPSYAPELNPVENIWAYLRANKFGHQVWNTYDAILDATCAAWNALTSQPDVIRSTGHREWAEVRT